MVYTPEQRLEALAKAREAKKAKSDAKKQDKLDNPPPKGRPKKVKEVEERTLDLELPPEPKPVEPEIEEQIIYQKVAKPKKKIVRKIIQQYESTSEEEEEIVYVKPKREQRAKVRVEYPEPDARPREPEMVAPKRNMFFSY